MVRLDRVIDVERLEEFIGLDLVRRRMHPKHPELAILNYTEQAQAQQAWNRTTAQCRGLVYNTVTGEVLARPMCKFFNWNEKSNRTDEAYLPFFTHDTVYTAHHVGLWQCTRAVDVAEKLDGSLGILFFYDGEAHIATRGSFDSEQAVHATRLYRERYHGRWQPDPQRTYLFEIVYPQNHIVVNYGALNDLVFLGSVDLQTGMTRFAQPEDGWPGPRTAKQFPEFKTLDDVLSAPEQHNAEGYVVRFRDTGVMVKVKFAEYLARHEVRGSPRAVWEILYANAERGTDVDPHLLDDEWFQETATALATSRMGHERRVCEMFAMLLKDGFPTTKSEFARRVHALPPSDNSRAYSRLLFMLFDKKPIKMELWRMVKP